MTGHWLLASAPVLGLAAAVIVQIAGAHTVHRTGSAIIAGISAGLACTVLATAFGTVEGSADWAVSILTYVALAFGYWAFLNLNITSIRIRMLREILASADGISQAELEAQYSAAELLERRLNRLEAGRQLSCLNGCWHLESRTLLVLARTIGVLRAVIMPTSAR